MECNKGDAEKAKEKAEEKFKAGDVVSAQRWLLKAKSLYPDLPGLPHMLTAYDVHIAAATKKLLDGKTDWHAVLGIGFTADKEAIKKQYKRMCILTHPDKNRSAAADGAFKLIQEAWNILSESKSSSSASFVPKAAPMWMPAQTYGYEVHQVQCPLCRMFFVTVPCAGWHFMRCTYCQTVMMPLPTGFSKENSFSSPTDPPGCSRPGKRSRWDAMPSGMHAGEYNPGKRSRWDAMPSGMHAGDYNPGKRSRWDAMPPDMHVSNYNPRKRSRLDAMPSDMQPTDSNAPQRANSSDCQRKQADSRFPCPVPCPHCGARYSSLVTVGQWILRCKSCKNSSNIKVVKCTSADEPPSHEGNAASV